ncbi:MAG: hypothetical protein ACOCQR_03045 [bacterium]
MNIIEKIDKLMGEISEELNEDVEFDLNIFADDKEKSHRIKERLIKDGDEYCEDEIIERYDYENEEWIILQIGSSHISIWH